MPQIQVDFTAVPQDGGFLTIINFTMDTIYIQTEQELTECCLIISNYIDGQFDHYQDNISLQVTASYYLRNTENDDRKLFTGSFFTTGNDFNVLSGQFFFPYRPETFLRELLLYANPERAANLLTNQGLNTKWEFDVLDAVILNAQVKLPQQHNFIRLNKLDSVIGAANNHGSKRRRRHIRLTIH